MKNITPTIKIQYLIPLFLLFFISSFAQNGIIGDGFGTNNWSTVDSFSAAAGTSRIFTAKPNATGNKYFRLTRNWGGNTTQFGPSDCVDTDWTNPGVIYGMSACGSGAFFINCPNTTDNYVFKTPNGGDSNDLLYFRVEGDIRTISTVTQSPLASQENECGDRTITATLDGDLAVGQAVYLRFTNDAWATSTVVPMTGSATTYTAEIPSSINIPGANVSYYTFTSGISTPTSANADFFTINLNSNSGSNYSYAVSGLTTSIPDPIFEQVLIDMGLDCILDGKVITNKINTVTILDIRNKNITNLSGIKAFTNLQRLYCQNIGTTNANAITTLDVSGLAQLRYLYCQNNLITDLNITGLASLEALDVSNNPLVLLDNTLDVSVYPNLYYLVCQNIGLNTLDVSSLTNLQTLVVWNNNLATLDLSNNPHIIYLDCDDNHFTTLNVSNMKGLVEFYCSGNDLTTLDLRGLSNLTDFIAEHNSSLTCILVDDVNAAATALYWVKDNTAVYSYCDCSKTTTWSGTAWSDGAPTTGDYAAVITNNYNESASINACSLTIDSGAVVTIPSGTNVTLNAPVIVELGGSFTLSNNANLIQTNKNSINSGEITVLRNSNPLFRLDYTLWSSPVSGTQTLGGFSPLTTADRFYSYNSATNLYNAKAPETLFAKGNGYLIRMPNEDPSELGGSSQYALGNVAILYNGSFTGTPNNGTLSLSGLSVDSYYAVGNPFPSTINADLFLTANTTGGTLYFWRKSNGVANSGSAYASYTALGGTAASNIAPNNVAPNGTIQVGQGFIVKTGLAATTLDFTNTMREAIPTSTQFFKTKKTVEQNRLWLNLTNTSGAFSQTLLGYMTGATQGVDNGIDGKYINDSPIALTSNINNEEYAIQGRALPFDPSDVVALNFKTNIAATYTIALDHADGLFTTGQEVYLVDSKTGVETDLNTDSYTFTADSGIDNSRFSLKYQKTLGVNSAVFSENSVTVYKNNGTLYVTSGVSTINSIKVFDIQGRLVAEQNNVKSNTATIKNLKAKQQVLIVQVTSEDNKVVSKKVVN